MFIIIGLLLTPVGFAIGYRIVYLIAKSEYDAYSRITREYEPDAPSRFLFVLVGFLGAAVMSIVYPVAIPLALLYWILVKSKFAARVLSKLEA